MSYVNLFVVLLQEGIRQAIKEKQKEERADKINENRDIDTVTALARFQSKKK